MLDAPSLAIGLAVACPLQWLPVLLSFASLPSDTSPWERCGASCTGEVWAADADMFTCGERITFLMTSWNVSNCVGCPLNADKYACHRVGGSEFPVECGGCCTPNPAADCTREPITPVCGKDLKNYHSPCEAKAACQYNPLTFGACPGLDSSLNASLQASDGGSSQSSAMSSAGGGGAPPAPSLSSSSPETPLPPPNPPPLSPTPSTISPPSPLPKSPRTPSPPPSKETLLLTLTASGSVSDYADSDKSSLQQKVSVAAGVDKSLVTIRVTAASVHVTATIAVPASMTADEVKASLSATLGTADSASAALGLTIEEVPTFTVESARSDGDDGGGGDGVGGDGGAGDDGGRNVDGENAASPQSSLTGAVGGTSGYDGIAAALIAALLVAIPLVGTMYVAVRHGVGNVPLWFKLHFSHSNPNTKWCYLSTEERRAMRQKLSRVKEAAYPWDTEENFGLRRRVGPLLLTPAANAPPAAIIAAQKWLEHAEETAVSPS